MSTSQKVVELYYMPVVSFIVSAATPFILAWSLHPGKVLDKVKKCMQDPHSALPLICIWISSLLFLSNWTSTALYEHAAWTVFVMLLTLMSILANKSACDRPFFWELVVLSAQAGTFIYNLGGTGLVILFTGGVGGGILSDHAFTSIDCDAGNQGPGQLDQDAGAWCSNVWYAILLVFTQILLLVQGACLLNHTAASAKWTGSGGSRQMPLSNQEGGSAISY